MTNLNEFYEKLKPQNWGDYNAEDFDEYYERSKELMPNFPKSALKSWIHRHYLDAVREYGWVDLRKIIFKPAVWTTKFIYDNVSTHKMEDVVEALSYHVYNDYNWLGKYFLAKGTWNTEIIVLQNDSGLENPYGEKYGKPYHLIEGHRRLGYLRRLFREKPSILADSHQLWLVTIENS